MDEQKEQSVDLNYYDEDGNLLEPDEIDWSDKLIEEREEGGFLVKSISGDAKAKRDNILELVSAYKGLQATDYISAKVMDALLSISSITELLKTLTSFGDEYREKLSEREVHREKIRELEADGVSLDDLTAPFKFGNETTDT